MNENRETDKKLSVHDLRNAEIIAEAASGKPIATIAADRGRNRYWLSNQLNHPKNQAIFSEIYAATIDEAKARLPNLVKLAFDQVERTLTHSYDQGKRLEAAKAILNLAGKHWKPLPQPGCNGCTCCNSGETVIEAQQEEEAGL